MGLTKEEKELIRLLSGDKSGVKSHSVEMAKGVSPKGSLLKFLKKTALSKGGKIGGIAGILGGLGATMYYKNRKKDNGRTTT